MSQENATGNDSGHLDGKYKSQGGVERPTYEVFTRRGALQDSTPSLAKARTTPGFRDDSFGAKGHTKQET